MVAMIDSPIWQNTNRACRLRHRDWWRGFPLSFTDSRFGWALVVGGSVPCAALLGLVAPRTRKARLPFRLSTPRSNGQPRGVYRNGGDGDAMYECPCHLQNTGAVRLRF